MTGSRQEENDVLVLSITDFHPNATSAKLASRPAIKGFRAAYAENSSSSVYLCSLCQCSRALYCTE